MSKKNTNEYDCVSKLERLPDTFDTPERRIALLRYLCRNRKATVAHLAEIFKVSVRTMQRDIEALSLTEPIYTKAGGNGGGVYVVDGYYFDKAYMYETEISVLKKLYSSADSILSTKEKLALEKIILNYTKPVVTGNNLN